MRVAPIEPSGHYMLKGGGYLNLNEVIACLRCGGDWPYMVMLKDGKEVKLSEDAGAEVLKALGEYRGP